MHLQCNKVAYIAEKVFLDQSGLDSHPRKDLESLGEPEHICETWRYHPRKASHFSEI